MTACTLGGPDLQTLFITTSALGHPGPSIAGAVFSFGGADPGFPTSICAF